MSDQLNVNDSIFKSAIRGNTDNGWKIVGYVDSTYLRICNQSSDRKSLYCACWI